MTTCERGDGHRLVGLFEGSIVTGNLRVAVLPAADVDGHPGPFAHELRHGERVAHGIERGVTHRPRLHIHRSPPHTSVEGHFGIDGPSGDPCGKDLSRGDSDEARGRNGRACPGNGHRGNPRIVSGSCARKELVGHVLVEPQRMRKTCRSPGEPVRKAQYLPHLRQVIHLPDVPGERRTRSVGILREDHGRLKRLEYRRNVGEQQAMTCGAIL